jgi:hypothetical protein
VNLFLDLSNCGLPVVKNSSDQSGVSVTIPKNINDVRGAARAARSDHWHRHGVGHATSQLDVVSIACSVLVDAGEENFASTPVNALSGPGDRLECCPYPPASHEDNPAIPFSSCIDARYNALRPEPPGRARNN